MADCRKDPDLKNRRIRVVQEGGQYFVETRTSDGQFIDVMGAWPNRPDAQRVAESLRKKAKEVSRAQS